MDDHTPTPWEVMPSETWHHLNSGNAPSSVFHIGDYTVVTDTPSYEFHAEDSADAAFIVKAVNAHDALVKALEEEREYWAGKVASAMLCGLPSDDIQDCLDRISAVLDRVGTAQVSGGDNG